MAFPPLAGPNPVVAPPVLPPRRRWARVWWLLGPLLVVMLVAAIVGGSTTVPYTMLSPGSASPGEPLVRISGHPQFKHAGQLLFVTVTIAPRITAGEAVYGWLDPDRSVRPSPEISGTHTVEEDQRSGALEMRTSKEAAVVVALRRLGYAVPEIDSGALVSDVGRGTPAYGKVGIGDAITGIDGESVAAVADLRRVLAARKPGDRVNLTVRGFDPSTALGVAGGKVSTVAITLASYPAAAGQPADPKRAYLGVSIETDARFTLPFPIDIDSGRVGGPSAGLAFTLTLIDRLSETGILNKHRVAVTGTIDLQGHVGPVGGVPQKTITVRRAGAELFIVPSSEYRQAKANAGRMRVAKADTLDQALQILQGLGS